MMRRRGLVPLALILAATLLATAGVVFARRVLWAEPSAERCLGFALPAGSRVVAETGRVTAFGGERFFVIGMTRDQFEGVKAAGGFAHRPDLVSYWPGGLDAPPGFPWMADPINDPLTIYRQAGDALDVARWEDGRLYYRHHVP